MSNKKFVKKLLPIIMAPSLVCGVALQAGNNMPAYAAEGTWIYVDGANGNDNNDGKSAGSAVKSWEKARNLLGCDEGGIYVTGTVDASGDIYTKNPEKQTVKRTSDIVMFNVSSEATFISIDVDGGSDSGNFNEPAIKPEANAKLNFLKGAKFHNVGYVEDSSKNDEKEGYGMGQPDNLYGSAVCLLTQGVTILVDGAEFTNNDGKGIFFAPLSGFNLGPEGVSLTMKSGKVTGNKGYFYHNECTVGKNDVYIYNALIANNDASKTSERYSGLSYRNRTGVIYVCDSGTIKIRSLDGAAIFDNDAHDILYLRNDGQDNITFENNSIMLGGGNPNWEHGTQDDSYEHPTEGHKEQHYDVYNSNPSDGAKSDAEDVATSIFTGNQSTLIDSNGTVHFGKGSETVPETPTVQIDQTCEDVTTTATTTTPAPKTGSLATTVSVDGKSSSASKSVEVEAGTYSVDDTITYTDLTGGATYIIKGQLVCVDDETVISTKDEEFVADDSGSGTWTVTFENVNLEAGKKYVVYESAVNKDDANDKAEHKDKTAKAQTVVVKKESETTTSKEETTTSKEETTTSKEETTTSKEETTTSKEETTTSKEETTTPKEETTTSKEGTTTSKEETTTSKEDTTTTKEETTKSVEETTTSEEETTTTTSKKGELATTVKAGGKTASADAELSLTFDETKAVQTITDTITYTNLVKGVTYTVTGTIVEIDENGKIINPEVATNTIECVADDVNGEWEMNFENVTIQPLKKYVVFESAYAAGGEDENATQENPITHKDVNDKAQTIITEGENEKILDDVEEGSTSATVIASADSNENNGGSDNNSGNNNGNNGGSNSNGSSSKGTSGPNTGDSANTALYVTAAVAAAGIAVTSIALGTKKRSKRR